MHMLLFLVSTPINNRLFNMVIQITLVFFTDSIAFIKLWRT